MPHPGTLSEETTQQVDRLGPVDFVVGVASYNNVETIAGVVQAAWAGLQRAAPGGRLAVIHTDAGSHDGTAERARAVMPDVPLVQMSVAADRAPLAAAASRGGALQAIFALVQRLGARGCVVLDAGVTSLAPDWVGRLLAPVESGRADFVAPYYVRPRFAGAITTGIVYPFLRALYGKRVRYPVGGEFACSAALLHRWAAARVWDSDGARLSIDLGLTMDVLAAGVPMAQAFLGVKSQAAGERTADLSDSLTRALGAMFSEAQRTASVWQKVRGSQPVPIEGISDAASPEPAAMDRQRALDAFRLGERNLHEIWSSVLPPLTLLELSKLARLPDAAFQIPDALWARIVYDFALAYRLRVMNRDHLLAAFTPLYAGWLGSFVGGLQAAPEPEVERRVEQLCLRYEAEKPYLISRWRWPDRFNP